MTVADRIAVMNNGVLVQVDPPAAIYEQPATKYVADFIGDVNILPCKVQESHEGNLKLASPLTPHPLHVSHAGDPRPGDDVWLAIRPEKLRISLDPPAEWSVNCLSGEVWDIGYLGDMSIYHVRLPDGRTLRASMANATRTVERPISWDDKVWLSWSRDAGVVLTR